MQRIGKDGKSQQQRANLRTCMSCEWIFQGNDAICPKCTWPSYGAHFVYGDRAYKYAKTQEPWKNKKMTSYLFELNAEINNNEKEK